MKKILSTLLIVSHAFISFGQGVSGGLKAGLNLANQKFEGNGMSLSPDGRTSFHAGAFVSIMASETFGIQPEVLYNSVGSEFEFLGAEATLKFHYLSVPVLLKYNPVNFLNLHAGPQFGFLLSAKGETDEREEDIDKVKPMDFGIAMGVGLELSAGVTAAVRYTLGMADVSDTGEGTLKNNVVQLSLGYKLFGREKLD